MKPPALRAKPKFKGFRRKHWMVGGWQRDWHFNRMAALPEVEWHPLTRTWREGDPLIEFGRRAYVRKAYRYVRDNYSITGERRA